MMMLDKIIKVFEHYREIKKSVWIVGVVLAAVLSANFATAATMQMTQSEQAQLEQQLVLNQKMSEGQPKVSLELDNVPLISALRRLTKKVQVGFSFQEYAIPNKKVTASFDNVPVYKVLYNLLEETNLEVALSPDRETLIIRQKLKQNLNIQLETVSGTVTDAESGETLPGVNVMVKGTTTGASTDSDGHYELDVSSLQDTLIFSFIGYQTQEVPIDGRTTIDVELQQETIAGEELVVVGYGTQKAETVTGSISSIQTEEISQSPAANLSVSLAGRLPGLTSIQSSGQPGESDTRLYLRGRGTTNGQNPLVLVDGVERDLNYIDPNEVSDVTILKDASATAVYGVRGANGVVLVTTKRGKRRGRPEINFSSEFGLQDFTREPEIVSSSFEWAKLKNKAAKNDGQQPVYDYNELNYFLEGDNPLYPNNNWKDILLHEYVPQQRYNLNLSGSAGADDAVRYFVNVGYLNKQGQFKVYQDDYDPSSYLNRYNFRSNIDANLTNSLSIFLNVAGYLENVNSPNQSTKQILAGIYSLGAPVIPGPLTPEGEVVIPDPSEQLPPYGMINRSGYRKQTRSNVIASFGMEQDLSALTRGLSIKLMGSFDTRSNYNLIANKDYERYVPQINSSGVFDGYKLILGDNTPLNLSTNTNFESSSNFQLFINYDRTYRDKHAVTGLIFGQKDLEIRPGDRIPYNLIGLSSRVTYGYDEKYFLELNAGYNGSEQFSEGNRFGSFPSASVGWLISDENFLKDNSVLSHLKLRVSYGLVGNDRLGGRRFLYLDNITVGGGGYSPSLRGTINESYVGNSDIRWEVSEKTNIGIEIGLYNELNLTVDLFKESRDNVLIGGGSSAPLFNGLPLGVLPPTNQGNIDNKGFEIVLDYNKALSNDFSIFSRLNFNYAHNEVKSIEEIPFTGDFAYPYRREGFPIGQQFGYQTDGYFNSQGEIDSYAKYELGGTPRPGDLKYKDLNGDDIIDEKDIGPIGYSNVPEYTFGLSLQANYKNFDFSLLFQGVTNVSNYVPSAGQHGVFEYKNYFGRHRNAWTKERVENGKPIDYPALSISGSTSTNHVNDFFVERTDYVRLKNAEIGYTLPSRWTNSIGSKKARMYVNGLNLLTWDKMSFKDYDPELRGSLAYPIYRIANFGFNISF